MAIAVGVLVLALAGMPAAGLSGADEPAHLLNGYFVSLYLKNQFGANPLAFATDFYLHYPKISIGHWPPAYYGFLGVLFLVVPATIENAFLINLLVSALPAAGVAFALARVTDTRTALLGALVYALTPLVLGSYSFFMLDQALAACTTAAASSGAPMPCGRRGRARSRSPRSSPWPSSSRATGGCWCSCRSSTSR